VTATTGQMRMAQEKKIVLWVSAIGTFLVALIVCGSLYFYLRIQRLKVSHFMVSFYIRKL